MEQEFAGLRAEPHELYSAAIEQSGLFQRSKDCSDGCFTSTSLSGLQNRLYLYTDSAEQGHDQRRQQQI